MNSLMYKLGYITGLLEQIHAYLAVIIKEAKKYKRISEELKIQLSNATEEIKRCRSFMVTYHTIWVCKVCNAYGSSGHKCPECGHDPSYD